MGLFSLLHWHIYVKNITLGMFFVDIQLVYYFGDRDILKNVASEMTNSIADMV